MEMDVRRSHVVYRGETPIWEFGSEEQEQDWNLQIFFTQEKHPSLLCLCWGLWFLQ